MRIANLLPGEGLSAYEHVHVPAARIPAGITVEPMETGFHLPPDNRAAFMLDGAVTVAAAVRAERAGFAAAIVNGADYGLAEIRAAVDLPTVGAMEESMLAAARVGGSFAVVQVWPEDQGWIHEQLLREYGLESRCTSLRFVTSSSEGELVHEAMYEGVPELRAAMTKRIQVEIDAAVREGAEAIVLGCTCMCSVLAELTVASPVPVVDGIGVAFEKAVSLARGEEKPEPPLGIPVLEPGRQAVFEQIAGVLQASGLSLGNEIEACEVCAPIYGEDGEELTDHESVRAQYTNSGGE